MGLRVLGVILFQTCRPVETQLGEKHGPAVGKLSLQEKTFRITGFAQANPAEGKISDESPVGKALMGHKVGDKVVVEAPRGEMTYKIVKIDIESK